MGTHQSTADPAAGTSGDVVVLPFDAPLGAEVRCGDVRKLDARAFARIRAAWLEHLVLVFRGQALSDDDVLDRSARGTRRLGTRKVAGVRNAARSGDDVGLVLHAAIIPAPPLG